MNVRRKRSARVSSTLLATGLLAVLGGTLLGPPPAEARRQARVSPIFFYHSLDNEFSPRRGLRVRGLERKSREFASVGELVVENREEGTGGVVHYSFYRDFGSNLFVFGNVGFGAGKRFYVRNRQYLELDFKFPSHREFVTVLGVGRNDYGDARDLQTTFGFTYYFPRVVLQYRWFRFDNPDAERAANGHFLRGDWYGPGRLDLGLHLLDGADGRPLVTVAGGESFALFDGRSVALDALYWFDREELGVQLRLELGELEGFYTRRGIELGPVFAF